MTSLARVCRLPPHNHYAELHPKPERRAENKPAVRRATSRGSVQAIDLRSGAVGATRDSDRQRRRTLDPATPPACVQPGPVAVSDHQTLRVSPTSGERAVTGATAPFRPRREPPESHGRGRRAPAASTAEQNSGPVHAKPATPPRSHRRPRSHQRAGKWSRAGGTARPTDPRGRAHVTGEPAPRARARRRIRSRTQGERRPGHRAIHVRIVPSPRRSVAPVASAGGLRPIDPHPPLRLVRTGGAHELGIIRQPPEVRTYRTGLRWPDRSRGTRRTWRPTHATDVVPMSPPGLRLGLRRLQRRCVGRGT